MRRSNSNAGERYDDDDTVELNAIHTHLTEAREEGMVGVGYAGADFQAGRDHTQTPVTRAAAAVVYVGLNALFLWLLSITKGAGFPSGVAACAVAAACYAVVAVSDPGYAEPSDQGAAAA
mmetsp:Transcript_3031/g.9256  ORF Transcript_3031/g.9256 Transcript_3031/m.9256 type:complete len:120 (+) Transcript_3031:408-767(+)